MSNILLQLEEYSKENPQFVLIVQATENSQDVEIIIFRGFSSSLTGATESDPDLPVLSSSGQILSIDVASSPYNPQEPAYIKQNLTPAQFVQQYL